MRVHRPPASLEILVPCTVEHQAGAEEVRLKSVLIIIWSEASASSNSSNSSDDGGDGGGGGSGRT